MKNKIKLNEELNHNWKYENKLYMKELTKFLDLTEQIKDEHLREEIIGHMLRCDMELTIYAEKKILDK